MPATIPARDGRERRAFFVEAAGRPREGSHPHQRGLREAEARRSSTSRPRSAARSPSASAIAREFGDIAENSEYDDAKNEQAHARAPHRDARGAAPSRARDREEGRRQGRRLGRLKVQAARHGREEDGRVQDRRLGRGESGRAQALERVAGRQGDHRAQEGRDGRGRGSARRAEVQDPRDQGRLMPYRARPGRSARAPAAAKAPPGVSDIRQETGTKPVTGLSVDSRPWAGSQEVP